MRSSSPAVAVLLGLMFAFAGFGTSGCYRHRQVELRFGDAEAPPVLTRTLDACSDDGPAVVDLDPDRPLTVIVHGCTSSGARFKTLSKVFEAHGQQTICFNYNDRDWINTSSAQLIEALEVLEKRFSPQEITVLGHSQGGLVARRALVDKRRFGLRPDAGFRYRLVTVSSPFSGIASAANCGKVWLHVLSLSVTVGVCMAIAGDKWTEIYPGSEFMEAPGRLLDAVRSHLVISTDERGTCRTWAEDGTCAQDDEVFALTEQRAPAVEDDPRATPVTLAAGHAAVVGENQVVPELLIGALQRHGVLAETPPERRPVIAAWLRALYER